MTRINNWINLFQKSTSRKRCESWFIMFRIKLFTSTCLNFVLSSANAPRFLSLSDVAFHGAGTSSPGAHWKDVLREVNLFEEDFRRFKIYRDPVWSIGVNLRSQIFKIQGNLSFRSTSCPYMNDWKLCVQQADLPQCRLLLEISDSNALSQL